ncbi:helix-turn-helix transcriptional regulator [Actinomadura coerulea]|uniref:helix-turn-helix transcriptional regulator n=1 Tax=Actinomadura coerulea TaxID=46159 RepID=UPI0034431D53
MGRDEELERLAAVVAQAPAVTVIVGEAGIGKSRLVGELAERPEVRGRQWLVGACAPIREPFPLGSIVEALRGVAEHLTGAALSPVAGTLRGLLPELAGVLPPAPESLDERAAEQHRMFRGLVELLAALGEAVLIVEDVHWADERTVEFLAYLLAAPPDGLSVVLTYRAEDAGPEVRALAGRVAAVVVRDRIVLRPLDVPDTRMLAEAILGAEQPISEELAAYLCERAGGLPLAVQELLALLRERGTLAWRRGRWARRAVDELDVPAGVRDSVLERAARLSPAAQAVAEAAAVLRVATPFPILAEVCRAAQPPAGLDEAVAAGMLAEQSGGFGFRHVLAAEAVYAGIPASRRADLHSRAADAVCGLAPVPLGRLAHHLREAGRLKEWAEAADRAAGRASELGDHAEATRLLEEVLRNARLEPARRTEMTIRLGWAADEVLHVPEITDLIIRALEQDPPPRARGELQFLLGLHLDTTGVDQERKCRAFTESVADLDDRPELAAWAMIALGLPTEPHATLPAERVAWLDRAQQVVPAIRSAPHRLFVLGKVAMGLALMGDARWSGIAERIRAEAPGTVPAHSRMAGACWSAGSGACHSGHHETARTLLTTALQISTDIDALHPLVFRSRAVLLTTEYQRGEWDGLRESIPGVLDGLSGGLFERLFADTVAACLLLPAGELDEARDRLRELADRCMPVDGGNLALLTTARLRLATARGEAAEAVADVAGAVTTWESRGMWPVGARALPALVESMLAAGRPGDAAGVLRRYESRLRGLDAPLAPAVLPHAHGLLAEASGDHAAAATRLLDAALAYDRLPAPYEAAQARERAAAALHARGDEASRARAADVLGAAVGGYGRLGASWDLERAARLARRLGLPGPAARARRGPRGYGEVLSPREREVAGLAATGMSNKDIARELFVSPKTVEKHVAAALRKLGLTSRAALGTCLEHHP